MQPVRARSTGPTAGRALLAVFLVAALLVLAALALIGYHLVAGLEPEHRVPVDVTVQLAPDATGTRVTVVERATSGKLPAVLDLVLRARDAGRLSTGGRLTDADLVYSDARDGQDRALPAEQTARRRLQVPTDGQVARVSFHVAAVQGRRVVYPVPGSSVTTWQTVRLPSPGMQCLTENATTDPHDLQFDPCPAGSTLDARHLTNTIRLELP